MPSRFYVFRDGKWVERKDAPETHSSSYTQIITDSMDETWHPCDGKYYTSKSQFRKTTKSKGCLEIGNEEMKDQRQHDVPNIKEDLLQTYDYLANR